MPSVTGAIIYKTSEHFSLDAGDNGRVLVVQGDWTINTIGKFEQGLRDLAPDGPPITVDVSALGVLDTAGAYLIDRSVRQSCEEGSADFSLIGEHDTALALLQQARENSAACERDDDEGHSVVDLLYRVGRGSHHFAREGGRTLSFIGETLVVLVKLLMQPHKIRWKSVFALMESAGLDALPIVAFLSFFVGMVIAFIGATLLVQTVGSAIFTVELVGWATLREFAVVLTGIILAGRTNSSFTAAIGAMKMRQEIDAMKTLGLDPISVLVVPRVIAMVLMVPILTFRRSVGGRCRWAGCLLAGA